MNRCKLRVIAERAAAGGKVIVVTRNVPSAMELCDRFMSLFDDVGAVYDAVRSNGRNVIRFANGGRVDIRSERQGMRGMSCDVFVLDEATAITEEAAPVADMAKERLRLVE